MAGLTNGSPSRVLLLLGAAALAAGLLSCGHRATTPPVNDGSTPGISQPATPASGMFALLPPLPPADGPPAKVGSAAQTGYTSGTGIWSSSSGFAVQGNAGLLVSKPNTVEWGMYLFNIGTGTLQALEPNVQSANGVAYFAVSNYTTGRWQYLGTSASPAVYNLAPANYANASGRVYFLVFSWNGANVLHNYTLARFDDGAAQGAKISGTILDENSLPLGGVYLDVQPGNLSTYSDASGVYSVSVPADDTYTLTPMLNGYSFTPASQMATVAGGTDQTGINFSGTSLDIRGTITEGGNGVGGVQVKLLSSGTITTTLADGTYVFQGVAPGADTVVPKLATYTFNPATAPVNVGASDVNGVDFAATGGQPAYKISGFVKDAVTAAPVAGAVVQLKPDYTFVVTDATGAYQFTNMAPDAYTLNAFKQTYNITPKDFDATITNADVAQDFSAQQLYQLTGMLRGSGGFPLAGINVTIMPGNFTLSTAVDGTYLSGYLAPGSYTVTPSNPLYTFAPLNQLVTITNALGQAGDMTGALTGAITYTNRIGLIVSEHCLSCHSPQAPLFVDPDLRTYADMNTWGGSANGDVQGGSMPPGNPLSGQLKEQFQAWFSAGKPQ